MPRPTPTDPQSPRPSTGSTTLPPLLFIASAVLANDFTVIALHPLKALHTPCPFIFEYAWLIIPLTCTIVWLILRRRWPLASAIITLLLSSILVSCIPPAIQSRLPHFRLTRQFEIEDLHTIEQTLGVHLTMQSDNSGTFLYCTPTDQPRVQAELTRLHLINTSS